ncbi:hypothetical protein [Mycobacterium sp.]|uniref:hypothetical protein n=1 Tax=Mycobacterium sp. TaxID=1785 RepID=UPI003C73553B
MTPTSPRRADRSKLDEIFGTELPQESSDDADRGRPVTMRSEEEPDNWDDREQWLRENVPPHHV